MNPGGRAVLGIGAVVQDVLIELPAFPEPDAKVPALRRVVQAGGPVPTALRALSHWGLRTALAARVGADPEGAFILRALAASGVDTAHCIVQPDAVSGSASVWLDAVSHTRTIAYTKGSLTEYSLDAFSIDAWQEFALLHLDGREPVCATQAALRCRSMGIPVAMDTGSFREHTRALLQLCDFAFMPRSFAEELCGTGYTDLAGLAREVQQRCTGLRLFSISDGARGSVYTDGDACIEMPAHTVDVQDSCGAGDVHSAAVIYGILQGWSLEAIAAFAPAAAACKCMRFGNADLPGLDAIMQLSRA